MLGSGLIYIYVYTAGSIRIPPSPVTGSPGRNLSHQSHVLQHRDTHGQAQVCSRGHQGSSGARGKRRGFSPRATAHHSQSAGVHTNFGFSLNRIFVFSCQFPNRLQHRCNPRMRHFPDSPEWLVRSTTSSPYRPLWGIWEVTDSGVASDLVGSENNLSGQKKKNRTMGR